MYTKEVVHWLVGVCVFVLWSSYVSTTHPSVFVAFYNIDDTHIMLKSTIKSVTLSDFECIALPDTGMECPFG